VPDFLPSSDRRAQAAAKSALRVRTRGDRFPPIESGVAMMVLPAVCMQGRVGEDSIPFPVNSD
jgi:hypothetical protein